MIDELYNQHTAVDSSIIDVEVTETILNCSNSNNEPSEPTKEKNYGNLRYFIFNLLLLNTLLL